MKIKFLSLLYKRSNSFSNKSITSDSTSKSITSDSTGAFSEESEELWCEGPGQNKTVTFQESSNGKLHFSRKEYTHEELAATWYKSEEYASIRRECVKQIKKMESGMVFKDKKYCSRGLENHTRLKSICKMQNKRDSIQAVFDEQAEQQRQGIVDAERIAKRYHQRTASCQLWACRVGLQDQMVVDRILD